LRTVLHADMDAFYASVEQRDHPELRGRPVAVGGSSSRGVVAAASYEARVFGVHSAMPSAQARKLCPDLVFVRGDMASYGRESKRIFEIFRRFTPAVEGLSLDEAFLDLSGTERLHGPARGVGEKLRQVVRDETGLAVSVGIAPVKMVAKIASDVAKPDGLLEVSAGQIAGFLEPLPVGRIWGIGPVARQRLDRQGVSTIGDLLRLPEPALRGALGRFGPALAALARGEDAREVEPDREAKSYGEENTFGHDVRDAATLRSAIRAHAEAIARRLRREGVRGRRITLKLKLARRLGQGRFPQLTRSLMLPVPTDDGGVIAEAGRRLMLRSGLSEPVRLLGMSVSMIEDGAQEQLALLPSDAEDPRRRQLNQALDQIQDRFGRDALRRGDATAERVGLSSQIRAGDD
jgi:DNA polymerase-4